VFAKDTIISFAKEYDPQLFHTNDEEATQSIFGGIIASGWQTCAEMMRLICDSYLLETASFGSPGIEKLNWVKPVRPNDKITLFREIKSKRLSKTNKNIGIIIMVFEAKNQKSELVLSMEVCQMIAPRR
jgi:acyl dehydratase